MERTSFARGTSAKIQEAISQSKSSGSSNNPPATFGRGRLLKSELMIAFQQRKAGTSYTVKKEPDTKPDQNSAKSTKSSPIDIGSDSVAELRSNIEKEVEVNNHSKIVGNLPLTKSSPPQEQHYVAKPKFVNTNEIEKSKCPVNKLGESGHKVELFSNFLRLNLQENYSVFEYLVTFNPEVDHKAFRIKMFKAIGLKLETYLYVGENLYVPLRFVDEETYITKHPVEGNNVTVKIKFVKEKLPYELCNFYNILFKKIMGELKLVRINRRSFDTASSHMIPQHKLQVWPGYVTAVEEYEDGLMLNMDPLHRILRTTSVLCEISDITRQCQTQVQETIKKALIGKAVLTPYNWKLYRIDDVVFDLNPLSKFQSTGGLEISFIDYYKRNYDKDIKDLQQPMLISRNIVRESHAQEERLICLIPELCVFTGLTEVMKDDITLMKDLAYFTRVTPNQRFNALKQFVKRIQECSGASKVLTDWGLSLSNTPINLEARQLPSETLIFGNKKRVLVNNNNYWRKEISMFPVISPIDINNWVVLYTKRDEKSTAAFTQCLTRCGPPIGINIKQPQMIMLPSDRTENYLNKLKEVINPNIQIVLCVFPVSRDDRYCAIKKFCCLTQPIPSQVVNGATIKNINILRAVSQNVLLQMNCKLGGSLWSVPIPYKKLMVVGLDVYHSTSNSMKSIGGFVSSYDVNITRWYSRICIQRPGQELINSARQCFIEALKIYFKSNNSYPDRIIVYRDGVADGQLSHCNEYEVPQFQSCFDEIDKDYNPALTFIIVQKRNNTRLFKPSDSGGQLENPLPGTVIDRKIVRKYLYDFYLVSQKVRESCLVPTHYIVLHDSSNMTPDQVQRFTFKMCHLYYNWQGIIRIPAPCQYAHKLAYLVGCSLQKEHHPKLMGSLFFL